MSELNWRKSSFTDPHTYVEVAAVPGGVMVRNSNAPEAGVACSP
ncbi:DUF397 domain-containing protein [Nocardia zapadnayensis]|nr:DUF397 domain-containing protein [Nocardia zapadnayensis]MCX0271677.1 DUF397 domain-containing protein [Nocardia zapadnayensis]